MPDIALLDVHLNEPEDGFALARWLRSRSARIGILMLTVGGDTIDRVVGLESGADDYVVKPFEARALVARVKALLRRTGRTPQPPRLSEVRRWAQADRALPLATRRLQLISCPASDGAARDRARPAHRADDDHRDDIRGKRDDADVEVADRLRQGGEQRADGRMREGQNRRDDNADQYSRKAPAGVAGLRGNRLATTTGKS